MLHEEDPWALHTGSLLGYWLIPWLCVCAGSHVLDEAERSLHDALCVLQQTVQDSRVIYGGGYPEMQMAKVPFVVSCSLCMQKALTAFVHLAVPTTIQFSLSFEYNALSNNALEYSMACPQHLHSQCHCGLKAASTITFTPSQ